MSMNQLKVLIVDDSAEDTRKAALLLQRAGHIVISANNGIDGVAMAKAQLPDLILMDVVMPGLNGFQATRQLSRDVVTCNIPVIVVSGKNEETDKVWAMRQGAKAYLTKAIERKTLFDTIGEVMS